MLHQLSSEANELEDKIKWERDQIVHSTNRTTFPLPDFVGKDCTILITHITDLWAKGLTWYHSFLMQQWAAAQGDFPFFPLTVKFLHYRSLHWRLEELARFLYCC